MFLFGYDATSGHYSYDANVSSTSFTKVEMTHIVADELDADLGNKAFTTEKGEWGDSSVFLATFNKTLECGNLSMGDTDVDTLRFKKRRKGELQWLLIDELPYDRNIVAYEVLDRLARSNIDYEYAIVPVVGNIEGEPITNSIIANFEGLWISDAYESYNIFCEVEYGTIKHNVNISTIELLDSKYPIVIRGENDYSSGNISGRLLSKESWDEHKMNYSAELDLRERMIRFLNNGKPKIIKNDKGRYYLVNTSNVEEKPYKYDNASITISFDWVEIGNSEDLETLVACDLLPEQLLGA